MDSQTFCFHRPPTMFSITSACDLQQDHGSPVVCESKVENLCFRTMERKPNNLNLKEKYNVIQMIIRDKKKVKDVAAHFNCGKTQIYDVMKHKDKIIEKYLMGNENDMAKRKERDTKYQELNDIVYKWFLVARANNFPVSGPILQQKAKEAAEILKIYSFSASNGWLQSFRKRHNITFGASSRMADVVHRRTVESWHERPDNVHRGVVESRHERADDILRGIVESCHAKDDDAHRGVIEIWHEKLKEIMQGYDSKDIANAGEMALFFRALPDSPSEMRGDVCPGDRHWKEHLLILLVAFADGKLEKPIVVGRNQNPKCFINLEKDKLPVTWKANKKACVTRILFKEFLIDLNCKMKKQNRNILLFLDNAACHPPVELSNIRLIFFPPSIKSVLHPLYSGIIWFVKMNYRKLMLKQLLTNKDDCNRALSDLAVKINVLDAITLLNHSLKCIPETCIQQCFINCGFVLDLANQYKEVSCDINLTEIQNLIEDLYEDDNINISAEDYINIDERVPIEVDEIDLESIETRNNEVAHNSGLEESEEENDLEMPSSSQVLQSLKSLKKFAKITGENEFFDKVVELGFYFDNMRKSQTIKIELDRFFE